jgi:hypothetical protein
MRANHEHQAPCSAISLTWQATSTPSSECYDASPVCGSWCRWPAVVDPPSNESSAAGCMFPSHKDSSSSCLALLCAVTLACRRLLAPHQPMSTVYTTGNMAVVRVAAATGDSWVVKVTPYEDVGRETQVGTAGCAWCAMFAAAARLWGWGWGWG